MKKEHYVILSNGEYSDYSPTYFRGEREITQNELDEQGVRIGDECMDWYENLPERTILDWRGEPERVRHDPETDENIWSHDLSDQWFARMKNWIIAQGYEQFPEDIPEINVSYSDIPTSQNKNPQ